MNSFQCHYLGNSDDAATSSHISLHPGNLHGRGASAPSFTHSGNKAMGEQTWEAYSSRLKDSFDLEHLQHTRLCIIGCGGGSSAVRNLARMGFGQYVLVDPDVFSESNIGSQQADPGHIGRPKTVALAEDIVKLNPRATVVAIQKRIEDIDDTEFDKLLNKPFGTSAQDFKGIDGDLKKPRKTILLALTDDFSAQARVNRLSLHFGLPSIGAQEYSEGLGGEVTYTMPEITRACHRCITQSRYTAYLDNGFKNTVTSNGAPIFSAEFLNAVIGTMTLAIAYHGTQQKRWGHLVQQLGNRNLIRVRMHPDFDDVFGNAFTKRQEGAAGRDSMLMLDTLFLEQTEDRGQSLSRPICPDCRGTGNLIDSVGSFSDTRLMRPSEQMQS